MTIPIEQLIADRQQAEALKLAGIETNDDFWAKMARDADFLNRIFQDPSSRAHVLSVMTREGMEEAEEIAHPLLVRNLPDLVVLAALALLLYGVVRDRGPKTPGTAEQVVVTAAADLPPFHILTPADVALRPRPEVSGSLRKLEDAVGRYSSQVLKADSVVRGERLNRGAGLGEEASSRIILQVTIRPTVLLSGTAFPMKASLIAAPKEAPTDKGKEFKDVLLLSATPGADGAVAAVVAVPAAYANDLAMLLGNSDLLLALPGR